MPRHATEVVTSLIPKLTLSGHVDQVYSAAFALDGKTSPPAATIEP